jgi:hypothetical protein
MMVAGHNENSFDLLNMSVNCRSHMFVNLKEVLLKLHGLSPQANYTEGLSDRRLSAKLVPTLADRGCRVVSTTNPPQLFILISVF